MKKLLEILSENAKVAFNLYYAEFQKLSKKELISEYNHLIPRDEHLTSPRTNLQLLALHLAFKSKIRKSPFKLGSITGERISISHTGTLRSLEDFEMDSYTIQVNGGTHKRIDNIINVSTPTILLKPYLKSDSDISLLNLEPFIKKPTDSVVIDLTGLEDMTLILLSSTGMYVERFITYGKDNRFTALIGVLLVLAFKTSNKRMKNSSFESVYSLRFSSNTKEEKEDLDEIITSSIKWAKQKKEFLKGRKKDEEKNVNPNSSYAYYLQFMKEYDSYTDEELINCFNSKVRMRTYGFAVMGIHQAIGEQLQKRFIDYTYFGEPDSLSFANKAVLEGKKMLPL